MYKTAAQNHGSHRDSDYLQIAEGTNQPTESLTVTAGAVAKSGLGNAIPSQTSDATFHIPDDLRQILTEVARQGTSSLLPWRYEEKSSTERSFRSGNLTHRDHSPWTSQDATKGSHVKHELHHRRSRNDRSSAQKRARMAISRSISDRQKLQHRSYYSSGGRSTTTSTLVVEPSATAASAKNKGSFPMNGSFPVGSSSSNLFLIRTTQSSTSVQASASLSSLFSPGSAGSGRTSGSEHEDTSQYECDSEGTSATSNSEMSFSAHPKLVPGGGFVRNSHDRGFGTAKPNFFTYHSLKDALSFALSSVLDFYYRKRGGYKLSPAEKRKYSLGTTDAAKSVGDENHNTTQDNTVDNIFQSRKKHILDMLGRYCDINGEQGANSRSSVSGGGVLPPFTIQRIAEVLMEPERYYKQTHKLCNCMEKLLLVTSSTSAFGDMIGEEANPTHREEIESTAVSEEKTRLRSEFRQSHRRTRRRTDSAAPGDKAERRKGLLKEVKSSNEPLPHINPNEDDIRYGADGDDESSEQTRDAKSQEALEAAARATLRTKFDHVGIDPHSTAAQANSRDVLALIESRRLSNSPPPPSLGHGGIGLRQHGQRSPPSPSSPEVRRSMSSQRVASPVIFNAFGGGVGYDGRSLSPPPMAPLLSHPNALSFGTSSRNTLSSGIMAREADGESRSPTSSDLDSTESDFDDSASDRSDGSDSGEPLTAARAMALNRMQQQVRMQGRGVRSPFQPHSRATVDSHYPGGEGIDATRAEDSGESDSSDQAD